MVKIYIFHSVVVSSSGGMLTYFHKVHFTSDVFVDNGEPAKFKLILKYFFFFLSQHNPIVSFAGSFRRKFFNCPLKFTAFIFAM